jgi:hypothetical protein
MGHIAAAATASTPSEYDRTWLRVTTATPAGARPVPANRGPTRRRASQYPPARAAMRARTSRCTWNGGSDTGYDLKKTPKVTSTTR